MGDNGKRPVTLLTGATGYIGERILRRLARRGTLFRCVVLPNDPAEPARSHPVEVVRADLTDPSSLSQCAAGVDTVIHAAAVMPPAPASLFRAVNEIGTANLLQAARSSGVRRFIYFSAVSATYPVKNAYGTAKARTEELVRSSGLDATILRLTMVYGGNGGSHFAKLVSTLRRLPLVIPVLGDGNARLQPVWVGDVVTAVDLALNHPQAVGRIYNVAGPTVVTFNELIDSIVSALGSRRTKIHVPMTLCRVAAHTLAALGGDGFFGPDALVGLSQDATLDIEPFRRECGFDPRPLTQGLCPMLDGHPPDEPLPSLSQS